MGDMSYVKLTYNNENILLIQRKTARTATKKIDLQNRHSSHEFSRILYVIITLLFSAQPT